MTDRHQDLMNEAFKVWEDNDSWTKAEWMLHLNFGQRVSVLTGTLNYQVENGGFAQWHGNSYSEFSQDLIRVLKLINTETMTAVALLVSQVVRWTKVLEWEDLCKETDWHSDKFYEINAQFLADVESFLQRESL